MRARGRTRGQGGEEKIDSSGGPSSYDSTVGKRAKRELLQEKKERVAVLWRMQWINPARDLCCRTFPRWCLCPQTVVLEGDSESTTKRAEQSDPSLACLACRDVRRR